MTTSTVENQIVHLREFLENCLGRKILDYSLQTMTKPGDNYGSIIHALTVTLISADDGIDVSIPEVLELVVKTPVTDEYLVSIYLPAISCVKENAFYSQFIPAMKQLQIEAKVPETKQINGFIEYIGSRLSLEADAKQADQNALLVLRNIKVLGFENGNRFQGFDKGTTFKILETMADMHALPIAIRILKPRRFEKTFRPHFKPIDMTYIDPKILPKAVHYDLKYVRINQTLRRKVDAQIKNCIAFSQINKNGSDTPYSTVVHRDLWTNNFMISKDENRNVNDVKVYDFQLYFYHSFALDVIFFLFTSVRLKDLNENFETFIRFYHHRFCQTLKDVNCPLDNYSFELMWEEIKHQAKLELLHILFMSSVSLAKGVTNLETDERPKPSRNLVKRLRNSIITFERYEFL